MKKIKKICFKTICFSNLYISIFISIFSALSFGQSQIINSQFKPDYLGSDVKSPITLNLPGVRGKLTDKSLPSEKSSQARSEMEYLFPELKQPNKQLRVIEGPGTSGGGGDVIVCGNYKFRLFKQSEYKQIYLSDTIELFKSGILKKTDLIPESIWMNSIYLALNELDLNQDQSFKLGDLVKKRLSDLKFILVEEDLPELEDDHINASDYDCEEKRQLAIQNLETGEVKVNKKLVSQLSYSEIYFFKIHEALISLLKTEEDTTLIRQSLKKAIEKVKLSSIFAQVSQEFIEIPLSLKYFWALKTLYSNKFLINFSPYKADCLQGSKDTNSKKILKSECINPILSWRRSYNDQDHYAFNTIHYEYYFNLLKAGFYTMRNSKEPNLLQVIQNSSSTSMLVYNVSKYFNPIFSFVEKDKIDLKEIEETHTFLINSIRNTYWNTLLGNPVNLIDILNEDFENFRKKILNEKYEPITDRISEPSDIWLKTLGYCYSIPNDTVYQIKSDNKKVLFGWLTKVTSNEENAVSYKSKRINLSDNFLSCLKTQNINVKFKNLEKSNEQSKIDLSFFFEKNFKDFFNYFQQNFTVVDSDL